MKLIWNYTLIALIAVLLIGFSSTIVKSMSQGASQNKPRDPIVNSTWISKRDNINTSLSLNPKIPIVDQKTTLNFEVKLINSSKHVNGLTAKLTLTDQDGRLYKFNNEVFPISNGKFSVDYFFPTDGDNKVIFRLFNNTTPMTVGSFDIIVPLASATGSSSGSADNNIFSNLFGKIFQ